MTPLALYLSAALHAWCPANQHLFVEAAAITEARYADIADTIATIALDPAEGPLFAGGDGRARTALLLASIASFESGCFRGDIQFCAASGDSGRAWGLYQSHAGRTRVCWSLQAATVVALRQVRESFVACEQLEPDRWLNEYASGTCSRGTRESRNRWNRARDWMRVHPWSIA